MSKKASRKKGGKKAKVFKPEKRATDEAATAKAATAGEAAPDTAKGGKAKTRKKAKREDGTMSGLDAAAKVLADAGEPLNAKTMVERMLSKGLWKTGGKTPQATIYAAIIREIAKKGAAARFKKTERGLFTAAS